LASFVNLNLISLSPDWLTGWWSGWLSGSCSQTWTDFATETCCWTDCSLLI
jgi:hypothetical protein